MRETTACRRSVPGSVAGALLVGETVVGGVVVVGAVVEPTVVVVLAGVVGLVAELVGAMDVAVDVEADVEADKLDGGGATVDEDGAAAVVVLDSPGRVSTVSARSESSRPGDGSGSTSGRFLPPTSSRRIWPALRPGRGSVLATF